MAKKTRPALADLVMNAKYASARSLDGLAAAVGTSKRTLSRWQNNEATPSASQLGALATVVYPNDRALAADLATAAGETLVSLGLERPPAPPTPASPIHRMTSRHLVDAVLCAAAEALDMSPRAMRPALAAALKTMRELGLTAEHGEAGLAEPKP